MISRSSPLISVCIPAYKRTHYLKRLLQSLAEQTFRDFEVIITDDSDDDSVKQLVHEYVVRFTLQYYKNEKALGTPANWNYAISKARGEWIKIMHDDDWFSTSTALQRFADATKEGKRLIVCNYNNINEKGTAQRKPSLSPYREQLLEYNPVVLLSVNYIGQPSVSLVHHSVSAKYDERMKWRVDIDFYMQLLYTEKTLCHIHDVLVNLGISSSQVTHSCLNVPGVELPEGWLLLDKYGTKPLKSLLVYDAWWRIIRNTNTRSKETLYQYAPHWPKVIENIVEEQSKIKPSILSKGIFSKLYMLLSYIKGSTYL